MDLEGKREDEIPDSGKVVQVWTVVGDQLASLGRSMDDVLKEAERRSVQEEEQKGEAETQTDDAAQALATATLDEKEEEEAVEAEAAEEDDSGDAGEEPDEYVMSTEDIDEMFRRAVLDLKAKIDLKLKSFQSTILSNLSKSLISKLDAGFASLKKSNSKKSFKALLLAATTETLEEFKNQSAEYSLAGEEEKEGKAGEDNTVFVENYAVELEKLEKGLQELSHTLRTKESNILISKITKKFQTKFKDCIIEELSEPTPESWDHVFSKFDELLEKLLKPYTSGNVFDFKIGLSEDENSTVHMKILRNFWNKFDSIVHDYINDDSASRILRNIFEDSFKFDSNGLPLIWKTFNQLDSQFNKSRDHALSLFPVLCTIKGAEGNTIQKPKFDIENEPNEEIDSDDAGDDNSSDEDDLELLEKSDRNSRFLTLLTPKQQAKVKARFKKETDAIYLDAKRSMVANKTSIPTFMYVLLILLGWNEFMTVIRNPVLFILAIIVITGLYFAYNLQMLGPMLTVTNAMVQQSKAVIKEKLRDVLLDADQKAPPDTEPKREQIEVEEVYELQDL
ncbi:hypothetical protein PMKS-002918 [Pichia membranifaciens]|uniref:Sey1/RHD3-like three-helix bundle domain-containing protein n=1 Tax=Pichia membranifaciens TaxID=4926 RepID=A0A1Q2YIP1_9ASCO|nr:hypothetical protein PMKS-002918 [Pichia membranifaciens]